MSKPFMIDGSYVDHVSYHPDDNMATVIFKVPEGQAFCVVNIDKMIVVTDRLDGVEVRINAGSFYMIFRTKTYSVIED